MKASGDENPESANFAVVGGETNESESLKVKEFVFDMDEALDVAMGNGQQIPAKADAPRVNHSDTMIDVTQSSGHSSLELFPLVLGGVLVVLGISFTAFVFHAVFKKKRDEQHEEPRCEDRDSKLKEKMNPMKHNSWVNGRYGTSLEMAEEGDAQSEAIPKVEDDNAILSWKDLSCTYSSKKSGREDIVTLSEVTGHVNSGELVAIMGPSGCGKSTLMDILSGRKTLGTLGGKMSLLGETMATNPTNCKDILRDVAAYVPQNEQFFPNQTPEEAVAFAANLKLGKDDRGDDVREKRISQILDNVGISLEARKRAIGGTLAGGIVIRGLSGGERKRLALACAVAMKPRLLFLDEITSGLDSENAVLVIELIKKLCKKLNAAAVVVIHQPSYEVFNHFDRLVLLSKGKCIYANEVDKISLFYDEIGRTEPDERHLVPSDVLQAAAKWDENEYKLKEQNDPLLQTCGAAMLQDIKNRKKPSVLLQLKTVLFRQMMNHYVRNMTNLFARVMIYGLTVLLLGAVFWQIADTEGGQSLSLVQARATFGAGIFLTQIFYLLPFGQISTFFFDKKLFAAESSIGLYPAWVYGISQLVLELWVMVLCALLGSAIAVPMMSLWNPSFSRLESFTTMFTVICVSGAVGNSLVMIISILISSQDLAFLVGSGNVTFFLAVSGGFVPFPYIAKGVAWLQWISPVKYSFQAFAWSLLSGTSAEALLGSLELNTPEGVGLNLGILIGVYVMCAILSVMVLMRQKEVR
mmetsp:Transcript_3698/g.6058  ORF Transcript_3698/g.6058 Transcript_3698/m.6058 type:complete len:752 (+) Transcript_3698:180-2435(+)